MAQANQIRELLGEFGMILPQDRAHHPRLAEILEDGANERPGVFRALMQGLGEHLKELDRQVHELEQQSRPGIESRWRVGDSRKWGLGINRTKNHINLSSG